MIVSNLEFSSRVESLHPLFKTLFDFVKSNDCLNAPLGRIEINGDNLFINNVELNGVNKEQQPMEIHRQYIDVHILLQGCETIGWKSLDAIEKITQHYDENSDCELSGDTPVSYTTLHPSDFMIVWPEDPHAPAIGKGTIRKLIAKVRVL